MVSSEIPKCGASVWQRSNKFPRTRTTFFILETLCRMFSGLSQAGPRDGFTGAIVQPLEKPGKL